MRFNVIGGMLTLVLFGAVAIPLSGQGSSAGNRRDGQNLFERETFSGNGRTCLTCRSRETGTVSPSDAQARFLADRTDPLFLHDGSDDGLGHGVLKMLTDATVLMSIPMAPNVRIANSTARSFHVRRGIPTTLNTPALDPVLMFDGRQPTLEEQATGAIRDHAQATGPIAATDLRRIKEFQLTDAFFSSSALRNYARGGPAPSLPAGTTPSERRGRRFFEDVPPNLADGLTSGLCSHCHSGPLLNQTNEFAPLFIGVDIPVGTRFANVGVSLFNQANNPVKEFIFNPGAPDEIRVFSPDPGRALVTGVFDPLLDFEAFKIAQLRGIRHTAPYFHDNSAKTLEDVAAHYAQFFSLVTGGFIQLTPQDQADMVAFMKLLD
jgi:cytochrome c peroxidase